MKSARQWIPKEENLTKLEQVRSISFLSVEGKIFFSVLSRGVTEFLLKLAYIDTSIQKSGIHGVPGCLKNTAVQTDWKWRSHHTVLAETLVFDEHGDNWTSRAGSYPTTSL